MGENVIIDGTWGGDTMQLCATLLANGVNVLGTTTVFGNTNLKQATRNAHEILHLLNADGIPIYRGAKAQTGSDEPPEGDNAHHADGKGGSELGSVADRAGKPMLTKNYGSDNEAVNFILQTAEEKPGVTLVSSGPVTNIAQAIKLRPDIMKKVKQIVVMGGCTQPMHAHDVTVDDVNAGKDYRSGNITRASEFNFYMAPDDAETVMSSGLPVTLLPMNCTHKLTVTPEREKAIREKLSNRPEASEAVLKMMTAPALFDRTKFNIAPVMHDVNCALYLLHPELYRTEKGTVKVSTKPATIDEMRQLPYHLGNAGEILGHTQFSKNENSATTVAVGFKEPEAKTADTLFDILLGSLDKCIPLGKWTQKKPDHQPGSDRPFP